MDALSRIFMQVGKIKHDHPHEDPPPWMPQEEQAKPEPLHVPQEAKPAEPPKPSAVISAETANRGELDRLGFKDKKNWNDVRAQKQDNAAALLEPVSYTHLTLPTKA